MIRRFIFVLIILLVWIIVVQSDRYNHSISAMPSGIGHSSNLSDPAEVIIESDLTEDPSPQKIRSQLYSNISTGMTYEEVSSIIGWQGILIYQTKVNVGGKAIETKVYQWNDLDAGIISNLGKEIVDPYRNLTLEFQDNVLVELPSEMQAY